MSHLSGQIYLVKQSSELCYAFECNPDTTSVKASIQHKH